LAQKLVDFSLTSNEWQEYKKLASSEWRKASSEKQFLTDTFEAFYEEAAKRDEAMGKNLLQAMESREAKVAVLVAGGFHANGITERLNKQGVAVITFVPKIAEIKKGEETAYLSVFTQEKTPLEQLFEGEKLFLSPLQMTGLQNVPFLASVYAFLAGYVESAQEAFNMLSVRNMKVIPPGKGSDPHIFTEPGRTVEVDMTVGLGKPPNITNAVLRQGEQKVQLKDRLLALKRFWVNVLWAGIQKRIFWRFLGAAILVPKEARHRFWAWIWRLEKKEDQRIDSEGWVKVMNPKNWFLSFGHFAIDPIPDLLLSAGFFFLAQWGFQNVGGDLRHLNGWSGIEIWLKRGGQDSCF